MHPVKHLMQLGREVASLKCWPAVKIQINVHARSRGQTANTTRPHRTLMKSKEPWKQGHCENTVNV